MTTITISNAAQYADSLAEGIRADVEAGFPFGYDVDRELYGESAEVSAYDYLAEALDIEYRVNSRGEYRSAKVLIGYGGPNVWLDTATSEVVAYWDTRETRDIPQEFTDRLDEVLAELWELR